MTRTPSIPRAVRGFTLLEVMLAVAVFAVLMAAISGVFFTGFRLRNTVTNAIQRAEPLERTVGIIRNDLANLVLPGGMMSGTLQSTPLQTATATTSSGLSGAQMGAMMSANPSGVAGQSSPLFYIDGGGVDETSPWADTEQVYYYLAAPTNNTPGKDLYRAVTRNLLPILPEEPLRQYLMSGVEAINVSFYQTSATQVGQWVDYWDSTTPDLVTGLSNTVPRAIRVELQLASSGYARSAPVEIVVPILVQASTNQVDQSSSTNAPPTP